MPDDRRENENRAPPGSEPEEEKIYWCDICRTTFSTKRCPQCGLKLKRVG